MNEVECLDVINNKVFIKRFYDVREQRKFILRCKYSKRIKVLSYTWQTSEQYKYLLRT